MVLRERPLPSAAPSRSIEEITAALVRLGVARVVEPNALPVIEAEVIGETSGPENPAGPNS